MSAKNGTTTSCELAAEFYEAEQRLRREAQITPDFRRSAQLADQAISWQKRRFAHIAECASCLRMEAMTEVA